MTDSGLKVCSFDHLYRCLVTSCHYFKILRLEAIPSQKCHVIMGPIINGFGDEDV